MNNFTINVTVNGNITFNELIEKLGDVEKAEKIPTPKALRERGGDPIAQTEDGMILAYANGYGVYDNGSGRTVVWLPDCGEFTYRFQTEPSEDMKSSDTIGTNVFGDKPWFLAVMVTGDHRVEDNLMNRGGSRKGTKEEEENEHGSREDSVETKIARIMNVSDYGNTEEILIRRETIKERLGRMTDRQRQVFLLYHKEGYTQQEIADMLGISQPAVIKLLAKADQRIKVF